MKRISCVFDITALKSWWRQRVASQHQRRVAQGPRPFAAIMERVHGPVLDGLIDVRDLGWFVLHDDIQSVSTVAIRCAAYRASTVPWGLAIGGPNNCRLQKDLRLAPRPGAKGVRFDLTAQSEFLSLSLRLDQLLECHRRHPQLPRRYQPRWPKFWAGFAPAVAEQLTLAGPEFEAAYAKETGRVAEIATRSLSGMTLVPLTFASHSWRHISAVFADLTTCPSRQVIALEPQSRNLRGYDGAVEYDLQSSRFVASHRIKRRDARSRHKQLVS